MGTFLFFLVYRVDQLVMAPGKMVNSLCLNVTGRAKMKEAVANKYS